MSCPIPILVYHQVALAPPKGQGAGFRSLYVSPAAFAAQMAWLKRLGYSGLSMSALLPYLRGERQGKVVGITFDDGYTNNLHHAAPVLQQHGFSSTCYAVSSLLGQTNQWDAGQGVQPARLMNADELRLWLAAGQEIGAHTHSHADLSVLSASQAYAEIAEGKAALEAVTGQPVQHFCYPYGRYTTEHVAMVRDLGFASATTTQRGRVHAPPDFWQLPRVPVLRATRLPLFWLKLATAYEDRRTV